jgi:hypothetical protein
MWHEWHRRQISTGFRSENLKERVVRNTKALIGHKLHVKATGWDGVDQIILSQNRAERRALVNKVMKVRVP